MKKLSDKLFSVEIWGGDALNDWQSYDCPDNGDTVGEYADWCIGEDSDYWAIVNSASDKIRLNGWYIIDGADYYTADGDRDADEYIEYLKRFSGLTVQNVIDRLSKQPGD